jgi:hypothetical protein
LKAIKKDVQEEDAYIQKAFDDARWLEESVAQVFSLNVHTNQTAIRWFIPQVELLAQQYGYTPKTRPKIDEAFEQYQEERYVYISKHCPSSHLFFNCLSSEYHLNTIC